jgi:hypothetical protein
LNDKQTCRSRHRHFAMKHNFLRAALLSVDSRSHRYLGEERPNELCQTNSQLTVSSAFAKKSIQKTLWM